MSFFTISERRWDIKTKVFAGPHYLGVGWIMYRVFFDGTKSEPDHKYYGTKRMVLWPERRQSTEDITEVAGYSSKMKYANFEDSKGVQVCDGDYLKSSDGTIRLLTFIDDVFILGEEWLGDVNPNDVVIIGNKYENPELGESNGKR